MNDNEEVTRIQPAKQRGGIWVTLGLEEYRIPPLGFRAIQDLQDRIGLLKGLSGVPSKEQMDLVVEIVFLAMQRNYPEMTLEGVSDMIDLSNFASVLNAVMNNSGFRSAPSGEALTTSLSIGTESTSS